MMSHIALYCVVGLTVADSGRGTQPTRQASDYLLRTTREAGSIDRVDMALEVGGHVQPAAGQKGSEIEMRVLANLAYEERTLRNGANTSLSAGSVRYYHTAAAIVQVGTSRVQPTLRNSRRLVGVDVDGSGVTLFSPQGPLTRDELDLIDLLGNSLLLEGLLPPNRVRVGESWNHSTEIMTALLGLDEVSASDVKSTLTEVTGGTARLDLEGSVRGTDQGASAEVQLQGKYRFDLAAGRITWFGLQVQEDRGEGLVDKAFEAVARLQVKISPNLKPGHLTDATLTGLPLEPAEELTQLEYRSPGGGWQFINDRRWFITADEEDRVVLLLIDGRQRIGQCHVSSITQGKPPGSTTMRDFQRDVERALGEHFGRFVRASQTVNDLGYRVFRLEVEGAVESLPMKWVYYLLAEEDGRRATMAFVVGADQMEHFVEADQPLVATFQFAQAKLASKSAVAQPKAVGSQ
jgi:hypothetical protein